ncbi:hypothetical protein DEU56DRAFT_793816 [Suillus clintonianus]|uniref:uncharacterized protein n=1 Tax=Suillus clintonianus TaxID=1904413 RepID=UPI001B884C40|nr:uncharacterized protein DEU56DRAFT_793816 [Suillus clintonianus]KAG2142377.1 hypothetical protein DEU56DRAFT_793816 [Suillus clintonianus]
MGDTEPTRESHLTAAAIIGGTVVAAMLLALLLNFVVVRFYRRKQKLAITPFNLPSTAEPTRVEPPQVWIELQSTSNFGIGVCLASSSRRSSTVQLEHPDPCLVQDGSPCVPSGVRVDPIPSPLLPLPNDTNDNKNDASTSTAARRQRSHELSKLYPSPSPSPSRIRAQHHRHIGLGLSVDSWVELEVMGAGDHHDDCSREPSEELPAYT